MAKYMFEIEVDQDAIQSQIAEILDREWKVQMRSNYSESGRVMSEAIKDLIYSRKDEIIGMVVDRASKEIVRKGLPKLLERMDGDATN